MAERMIEANGVALCTEAFGDPGDPPILLVMGMSASMLWWEEEFCRRLAAERRFVVRYDHRDTGRSVTYPPGDPDYAVSDLVADAAGVLDAYGLAAAHVVGLSMGGAIAQLLALDHPARVLSLVLITTSSALPSKRELPAADDRLRDFFATACVDWSDPDAVVDYVVAYWRVLWGRQRGFDEARIQRLAEQDVARARDVAAAQNHALLPDEDLPPSPLSSISSPTLVIHGTDDPLFPLEHGVALAEEIPDSQLLTLEYAGHGLDRADWETVIDAIIARTSRRGTPRSRSATRRPGPGRSRSQRSEAR